MANSKVKIKTHFLCQQCGSSATQWSGKCFECGAWNSLVEFKESNAKAARRAEGGPSFSNEGPKPLSAFSSPTHQERVSSGFKEVDRVLGGGFLQNSILLLGGVPGIGKSTLLLQILGKLVEDHKSTLLVSGEESGLQVAERAKRLGLMLERLSFLSTNDLEEVLAHFSKNPVDFLVVDSVQTLASQALDSSAGTVSQVREVAQRLMEVAKSKSCVVILVGHVTKDGSLAGPKLLEHMVDGVFYFESLSDGNLRILRSQKNRFGSAQESAVFEMGQEGLREVHNPSAQFLAERETGQAGSAVAALVEGSRCYLVEVQALVQKCFHGFPRRTFQGIDQNRVSLLLAVLEKYGIDFSSHDVFVKVAAGAKIEEAAADLSVAAALASARLERPLPSDLLFLAELSLAGTLRTVPHVDLRIQEARRMGFKNFVLSPQSRLSKESLREGRFYRYKNIGELSKHLWQKSGYQPKSAELSP